MCEKTPASAPSSIDDAVRILVSGGALATALVREGAIVHTSPAFDALFGPGAAPTLATLAADADRERLLSALSAPDSPAQPISFDALRADGSVFEAELVAIHGRLADGPAVALLVTDVTARRRTEKQLSYMAFLDPVTGLANRALLLDRLRDTLAASRRDGRVFAVMMCDLDGFKQINDTLGHEAGDAVLKVVARRLEVAVRESDTVARQGGDEFVILLSRVARRGDVAIVADRILRGVSEEILVGNRPCRVGVSIGIAACPSDAAEVDGLLARADAAMYASKHAGKNRFTFAVDVPGDRATAVSVPFLSWNDAHLVGVNAVDAQHRRLLLLVNQLGEDLKSGRERNAILASLAALTTFTQAHFGTEERFMAQHPGYPGQTAHVQEHRKLLDELTSMTVNVDRQSMMLTMRFLQEWLLRHIDSTDKPMAAWLHAQGMR